MIADSFTTECRRCGERATLPTIASLLAYVRAHDEGCPTPTTPTE